MCSADRGFVSAAVRVHGRGTGVAGGSPKLHWEVQLLGRTVLSKSDERPLAETPSAAERAGICCNFRTDSTYIGCCRSHPAVRRGKLETGRDRPGSTAVGGCKRLSRWTG